MIVEQTYDTQQVEHAYLETEAGIAFVDHDGVVTVHSPSQNITHHRHMLARILNLPINTVRMIMSPVGGGFGGKEDMIYQGMLALMAMKTRRPVRLVFLLSCLLPGPQFVIYLVLWLIMPKSQF